MMASLQDAFVSIIQTAESGISAGVSFLQAQIPDVIRQLILFNLVRDLIYGGGLFIFLVIYGIGIVELWLWMIKKEKAASKYDSGETAFPVILGSAVSLIVSIPAACIMVANITEALELWLAPKVWLIEYAATLIKH